MEDNSRSYSSSAAWVSAIVVATACFVSAYFFFHIVARCRHWRPPLANREAKGLAALPRPPGRGAGDSRRAPLYGRRWRRE